MVSSVATDADCWPLVRFGDVVENVTRNVSEPLASGIERYVGLDHLDGGDLRVRRWGSVKDGTTFTRAFDPGEVLFGKRRAYQRKAAVADFRGVCSGDLLVFASATSAITTEFLPFIVSTESFVHHALATSAGSLSPRTRWKDLAAFNFRLPPVEVQRRLAGLCNAALDYRDTSLAAAEAAAVAARVAFTAELEARAGSSTVHLADVFVGSPESGCSAPESPRETGHFVLGLQAVSSDGYVPEQFKAVQPTPDMLKARLEHGDLLVTRSNTLDRVGFAAIYREHRDDVSFPDTMMRLRPDTSRISAEFIVAVLMSELGRRHVMRVAAGTSASMKKINRKTLGAFEFAMPSRDTQREMLALHDARTEAARAMRVVAAQADSLTTALRRDVLGS